MAFTEPQIRLLSSKLNRKHVRIREVGSRALSYIEGWHVIAEANRIFGFDGWDRETVWAQYVWEDGRRDPRTCAYAARVRVRVRAGEVTVCREGSGVGHGSGVTLGEAHESALKEAETDAMKRALVTFGNLFGLALYDKEQAGVRGGRQEQGDPGAASLVWPLLSADGHIVASCRDPKTFCTQLRQAISACSDAYFLRALWTRNAAVVQSLHDHRPDLTTRTGVHFAAVLERVFEAQFNKLTAQNGIEPTPTPVDKSVLAIAAPRRLRDEEHLAFVATLPCLVCARTPSQAHHLRFAQLRALGRKVSDEWVVPLCNLHHRALHDGGNEELWWAQQGIDAVPEAERLWQERRAPAPLPAPARSQPAEPTPMAAIPEAAVDSAETPLGAPVE